MVFSALSAPLVRVALFLFYPIAFPIAFVLNKLLGQELPKMYSKKELMHIISEHEDSEHSTIDADEKRIVHGALQFSHRTVREVMTLVENVAMFDQNQRLTHSFFETVAEHGYSRFLVYNGNRSNIVGILFAKDLLVEDENIAIHETEEAFETDFLKVKPSDLLDGVLSKMLKQKRHIAAVYSKNNQCIGVISLEDIIEEILQHEIEDEADADEE
jgi:metal transporter CNNM